MFKKAIIALCAALLLTVALVSSADAQRRCVNLGDEESNSAYPSWLLCR